MTSEALIGLRLVPRRRDIDNFVYPHFEAIKRYSFGDSYYIAWLNCMPFVAPQLLSCPHRLEKGFGQD